MSDADDSTSGRESAPLRGDESSDRLPHLLRLPVDQHTLSRVVLKRFMTEGYLTVYDEEKSILLDRQGLRRVFSMFFDAHDALGSEERWQQVEDLMPDAYEALDSGSVFNRPDVMDTLRDLLALHWARSPAMKAAHRRVTHQVMAAHINEMGQLPGLLRKGYQQETGLHLAGEAGLNYFNTRVHESVVASSSEQWWSDRNAIHFEYAKDRFSRLHLHVGHADGAEFIIGDAPVITRKSGHDGVGPHQGVALGDAVTIFMPVSPSMVVGLGPEPAEGTISASTVLGMNALQIQGFERWMAARPGGAGAAFMRTYLPARTVLKSRFP